MPRVAKKKVAKKVIAAEAEAEALAETVTKEEIAPAEVEAVPMPGPTIVLRPPCALDDATVNSKIVVIRQDGKNVPIFATPAGMIPLGPDDIARKLPKGAKIQRLGPTMFVAVQLDPAEFLPPLVTTTAREGIGRFLAHFHHVKD